MMSNILLQLLIDIRYTPYINCNKTVETRSEIQAETVVFSTEFFFLFIWAQTG